MKLIILIPCKDEEKGIGEVISRCKAIAPLIVGEIQIVVIDDGSTDRTKEIAMRDSDMVISTGKNIGKGAALKRAYGEIDGDFVAITDGDGTYPVEKIPDMINMLLMTRADLVIGSRFLRKGRVNITFMRRIGNRGFSLLVSALTGVKVTDASSGLRVFRRKIIPFVETKANRLDYEVEMTTLAAKKLRVIEIPIDYAERKGRSHLDIVRDGIRFLIAILRASLFSKSAKKT